MRLRMILMALSMAFAGGTALADRPVHDVTIAMSNFRYEPSTVTLRRGEAYALHFRNDASRGHDFVAKEFFLSSTVAPEDQAKLVDGRIALSGGESVTVHVVPGQAGLFASHCSHFMHSTFGMTGKIVVQ